MNNKQSTPRSLIFFALLTVLSSAISLADIRQKVNDSTLARRAVLAGPSTTAPIIVPSVRGTALLWIKPQHRVIRYV